MKMRLSQARKLIAKALLNEAMPNILEKSKQPDLSDKDFLDLYSQTKKIVRYAKKASQGLYTPELKTKLKESQENIALTKTQKKAILGDIKRVSKTPQNSLGKGFWKAGQEITKDEYAGELKRLSPIFPFVKTLNTIESNINIYEQKHDCEMMLDLMKYQEKNINKQHNKIAKYSLTRIKELREQTKKYEKNARNEFVENAEKHNLPILPKYCAEMISKDLSRYSPNILKEKIRKNPTYGKARRIKKIGAKYFDVEKNGFREYEIEEINQKLSKDGNFVIPAKKYIDNLHKIRNKHKDKYEELSMLQKSMKVPLHIKTSLPYERTQNIINNVDTKILSLQNKQKSSK